MSPRRPSWFRSALLLGVLAAANANMYLFVGHRLEAREPAPSPRLPHQERAPANTCPICGQRSLFSDFGDPMRPRAICTACGTLERHRARYRLHS